jgi:hypothetical protein
MPPIAQLKGRPLGRIRSKSASRSLMTLSPVLVT